MNGLTKHIRAKTREVSAPEEVATTTNWLQALTNNEAKSILPVKEVQASLASTYDCVSKKVW